MTRLLRAALAIGALSYFAALRGGGDPVAEARRLVNTLPAPEAALPAIAETVPPEARERAARSVLARGLMAELSRRAGIEDQDPRDTGSRDIPSRDTLEAPDRQPPWRGAGPR